MTSAVDTDNPRQLVDALAAVGRAERLQPSLESTFNRGLILESLGLFDAAASSYAAYVQSDGASEWANEARERQQRLRGMIASPWRDAQPRLKRAIEARDEASVRSIVQSVAQDARAWAETECLYQWAKAIAAKKPAEAEKWLRYAHAVGEVLASTTGESLLADAVAAIKHNASPARLEQLATAHDLYYQARLLYHDRAVAQARDLFVRASSIFAAQASPMVFVADYYVAQCVYDENHESAEPRLADLLSRTPQRYRSLRAQIVWMLAQVHTRAGRLYEALSSLNSAEEEFRRLGERPYAFATASHATSLESLLGRQAEAWRNRRDVFRDLSETSDWLELQRALDSASRTESLAGRWENAYALLSLSLEPRLRVNPRIYASSSVWRGVVAKQIGLDAAATEHLADARTTLSRIPDQSLRDRTTAELQIAEASVIGDAAPQRALSLLDGYISRATAMKEVFDLPEALLQRARLSRRLGHHVEAVADLRQATLLLSDRRKEPARNSYPEALFHTADSVARELMTELLEQDDVSGALAAIDTSRGEPYGASPPTSAPLSDGTLLLEYAALPDRLLIFTKRGDVVGAHTVAKSQATINDVCGRFADGVRNGSATDVAQDCAALLLGPVANDVEQSSAVVVVPDGVIARVPFAALKLRTGRYLVETATIIIAPSAAIAFAPPAPVANGGVVIVGNPDFDQRQFPNLPPLPGAEREARAIGREYPHSVVLTRAQATTERMLSALADASTLHIAAHGIVVASDPRRSHILLAASEGNSGVFYLSDIQRLRPHTLALTVLAGCRTAANSDELANVNSLALAFLVAGSSSVIGSLWDVDDEVAEQFSIALHRYLIEGLTPAEAVRRAQLTMLHSSDTRLTPPSTWSAFNAYGAVLPQPKSIAPVRH